MLFNSPEFMFLFLPVAVLVHFGLARLGDRSAVVGTTVMSLLFYAWWKPPYVLLPILSILLNFWLAERIAAVGERAGRQLAALGITSNLLVLCWFKYADFLLSIIDGRPAAPHDVPLALSFTTFVQIAFLADVVRHRQAIAFTPYALFVSFFPHLIAGPIVRWNELGPQIADRGRYRLDWNNIALGLTVFTFGLAKKILIADTLSLHLGPVFDAAARGEPITTAAAWGAALAYSGQLYFDFSGYSEMAIGLGLLFNFRLPINFAAPFRATSVIDLWHRWHISLSRFLRDFVYVPLGGGQHGRFRRSLNLFITMTLGGLWHGAGWTFIAWGAFHGVLLVVNHAWRSWRGRRQTGPAARFAGGLATLLAFAIGMVFFRATDISSAGRLLAAMAGLADAPVPLHPAVEWDDWIIRHGYVQKELVLQWLGAQWSVAGTLTTIAALGIALLVPETLEMVDYRQNDEHPEWRRSTSRLAWKPGLVWAVVVIVIFVASFDRIGRVNEFLYYQF